MGLLEKIFLGNASKTTSSGGFSPFTFHSTSHQRYNHGTPEGDLQHCQRTFIVEKNNHGCDGYKLTPGDGWIIRCNNEELGRPQFAPKPMRVVSSNPDKATLRGYKTLAMSPFGWVNYDGDDYGLEVFYKNGVVSKCILYMHDRGIRIEYM